MKFSKLLLVLFFFVVLTTAIPVPLFENLFNKNKETEGEKKNGLLDGLFDIFKKKEVESTPMEMEEEEDTVTQKSMQEPVQESAQESAQESTQESTQDQSQNQIFDINNIPKDADVAYVVTTSVSNLIKNNLCSTLGNGANNLCEEISTNIINSISGVLTNVIKTSISTATGNSLSIACSIIPNNIFKTLSDTIATAISSTIAKNGGADPENVSSINNNVLTIIINTVSNLLCSGGTTTDSGDVIVSNIFNLINKITHKASYINTNVSSSLVNGSELVDGTDRNIAEGFSDIQNSIKMTFKAHYQSSNESYENNNYQSASETYDHY
eukprot:jgi/Orpsp1_1/1181890/evm.model.c7180000079035.1